MLLLGSRRAARELVRRAHSARSVRGARSSALPFASARPFASAATEATTEATTARAPLSPVEQYDANVRAGKIRSDEHQRKMLGMLNSVYEDLVRYERPRARAGGGLLARVSSLLRSAPAPALGPRGIYMYGDVGSGKTMLMDMFYTTVPAHLRKRRVHFHAFMQDMHKQIHRFKKDGARDPVLLATHSVAERHDVLCLDEVAVIDVADAMILRHIWESMYASGMVLFMTSNRHPDDLYKNGVQRASFVPAIELIKQRSHVVLLDSPTDYRKLPRPASGTYYFDSESGADGAPAHARRWFDFFARGAPATTDRKLDIWGRPVPIPLSAGDNVMQFTFDELCGELRSAADYLEMCRMFPAAVLTDIPSLSLEQRDVLRRFITFLDAAYDSHTKLAVTAEKPFELLFNTKHLQINPATNKVELVGGDDAASVDLSNFAGHEEMFAFARALSRLKQMSSEEWLDFERD